MSDYEVALQVIAGAWGNGGDRIERLTKAGYNYYDVQDIVNKILGGSIEGAPVEQVEYKTLEITIDLNKYNSLKINFEV